MNNAEASAQTQTAVSAPFVEAAAQYSGVFYDNLNMVGLASPMDSVSLLASTNPISQAVIRLMSRAGEKRSEHSHLDGDEDVARRRKIRRTQSYLTSDMAMMLEKRPQSVIIGPPQVTSNTIESKQQTTAGRLFLGSSPTECNKNFVFSGDPKTLGVSNENDSSEGAKSQVTLSGTAWQVGPSSSTNPAYQQLSGNVVNLLHNTQIAKPSNGTTLTLPNSIIQLSSLANDPFSPVEQRAFAPLTLDQQQTGRLQSVGQFAFQNLFLTSDSQQATADPKQFNTNYPQSLASGQENLNSGLQQNGYPPSGSRRTRRFSHHSSQNEPTTSSAESAGLLLHRRHKHLPRGTPTLQQIGRNLIEFARSSTPRIQRRIQSAKSHLHQNDNHHQQASGQRLTTSANNSPVHHLVYASSNSAQPRRSTHRQTAAHSAAPIHNLELNEQISCAHPDYHLGAFLDNNMRPTKLDALLDLPEPSQKEMEEHGWNPDDRSLNIYVKEEDRLTLHRYPVAQSTDCIRGKIGYSKGFHVWQIVWPNRQRGTHAVIGVATKDAPLHAQGYTSLVGSTTDSYGWDLIRNVCLHDSKNTKSWDYPNPGLVGERFVAPEKLYCILDMDDGTMAFATENAYLGVAFRGLKGQQLYPIACAVWGHCEVTLKHMGTLEPEPRCLMDACRRTLRLQMGPQRINRVNELPLPESLKNYIQYKNLC